MFSDKDRERGFVVVMRIFNDILQKRDKSKFISIEYRHFVDEAKIKKEFVLLLLDAGFKAQELFGEMKFSLALKDMRKLRAVQTILKRYLALRYNPPSNLGVNAECLRLRVGLSTRMMQAHNPFRAAVQYMHNTGDLGHGTVLHVEHNAFGAKPVFSLPANHQIFMDAYGQRSSITPVAVDDAKMRYIYVDIHNSD